MSEVKRVELGKYIYEKDVYAPDCVGMIAKVEMADNKTRIIGRAYNVKATCSPNGVGEMSVDFYVDGVEDLMKNGTRSKSMPAELFNAFNDHKMYDLSHTVKNAAMTARKVIYNPPATIVLWEDGTKTVVKCDKDDVFDEMKGLALCYMKKALGNTSRELNRALRKGRSDGQALSAD